MESHVESRFARKAWIILLVMLLIASISGFVQASRPAQVLAAEENLVNIPRITARQIISDLPNVIVIGTGGTISGQATNGDPTNFQSYRAGTYTIEEMVRSLPGLDKIADVNTVQFGNKGSGSIYSEGTNIIAGDSLNPQHARILLMLSLAFTDDVEQIREWFATIGTRDIDAVKAAN